MGLQARAVVGYIQRALISSCVEPGGRWKISYGVGCGAVGNGYRDAGEDDEDDAGLSSVRDACMRVGVNRALHARRRAHRRAALSIRAAGQSQGTLRHFPGDVDAVSSDV
jgi:hypothetical protein